MPTNSHRTNIRGLAHAERELRRLVDAAWHGGLAALPAARPELLRLPVRIEPHPASESSPAA